MGASSRPGCDGKLLTDRGTDGPQDDRPGQKRELEIDPLQVAEIWRDGMTLGLQARLCSRVEDRLLAVMRQQFGGHAIRSKP